MGEFDVTTQRRTQNVKSLTVLPAAEVLPALGDAGAAEKLERIAAKLEKKGGAEARPAGKQGVGEKRLRKAWKFS